MKTTLFFSALACFSLSLSAATPYINKVYEYLPAPGQFVNTMPEYESGDNASSILSKVEEAILADNKGLITLGALGGYVVFGFDHTIVNVPGQYDFRVWGNAMVNTSEPGVIYVMKDENGNGIPDDTWYEIAGSEYNNAACKHNLEITYYRPASSSEDIRWSASDGTSGVVARNTFHAQPYFPQWLNDETISYRCTMLPPNYTYSGGIYYLNAFDYGYADNHPNTDERSGIKIEWAVKADGSPANLSGIDFVKVATGLNQVLGPIGESSTEVSGAEDLHVDADGVDDNFANSSVVLLNTVATDCLHVSCVEPVDVSVYSLAGVCLATEHLTAGDNTMEVASLAPGVYILSTPKAAFRFVKY